MGAGLPLTLLNSVGYFFYLSFNFSVVFFKLRNSSVIRVCPFYALCQFSIFSLKNCLKSSIFRVTRIRPFTADIAAICPSTKKRDRGMSIGNFLFSHCIGYPRTPTFVQHVHKIECCLFHSSYRIFWAVSSSNSINRYHLFLLLSLCPFAIGSLLFLYYKPNLLA